MDGQQVIDGFDFNDNLAFNDKISAKAFIKDFSVETNRYGDLTLNGKTFGDQEIGENDFVN